MRDGPGDDDREAPERDRAPAPADSPSLVPRWLAWLVLLALVAAGACSVVGILSGGP